MTDDEAPQDLGERIRRIAATIAGEVDKRLIVGEEAHSILDTAARSLGATMESWGRNPSFCGVGYDGLIRGFLANRKTRQTQLPSNI